MVKWRILDHINTIPRCVGALILNFQYRLRDRGISIFMNLPTPVLLK